MDGPNVNWEVLDDTLVEDGHNKTLNIGSCAQHVIHAAFQTGSSKTESQLDKIMNAMFSLFKDSPARRDVFKSVTGTDIFPISRLLGRVCHVSWLICYPCSFYFHALCWLLFGSGNSLHLMTLGKTRNLPQILIRS